MSNCEANGCAWSIPRDPKNVRMEQHFNVIFNCFVSFGLCFFLSLLYIGSLHIWNSQFHRDHPSTIKKRFISVFFMLFIGPYIAYLGLHKEYLEKHSLYEILGLKTKGLCQATVMPLFLTMIFFLGPIVVELHSGLSKLYTEQSYWISNLTNLIWLRNHIVAPLSEEFTYRSCMLPLLLQSFSPTTSVILSPLLFGVAHFHHLHERVKYGLDLKTALMISCFQFVYTTLFGIYSAYLLLRTGHFASVFIVHAFCNHMGFPDVTEVMTYKMKKRIIIIAVYILGVTLWVFLLKPLTEPKWYFNDNPWYILTESHTHSFKVPSIRR
ncbi:CAAX prenyl protease 2 [Aethina tumida]|uniref:CAAX prenyl protease 2 n=1 Tax=Aethina tumida TaxID=116153 RepID=UPI0021480622|nr:CAAX prenyl protease 2 [Aethina tumida]